MELPPVPVISNDTMEAAIVRAVELLEEMAPAAAAALITAGLSIDDVMQEYPDDDDVQALAQFQMLGHTLFQCVQVLEMIRAASQDVTEAS